MFTIAVDFDGTCVEHEYPEVGPDVPGAVDWLRRFVAEGAQLILWTMRSSGAPRVDEDPLADAVAWFERHAIPLYGVNENPSQGSWTGSPKAYANVYIDDAAAMCPLRWWPGPGRPFVDWERVGPHVLDAIEASRRPRPWL